MKMGDSSKLDVVCEIWERVLGRVTDCWSRLGGRMLILGVEGDALSKKWIV